MVKEKILSQQEKQDAFNKVFTDAAHSAKSIPAYLDFLVMHLGDNPAELQYWVDRLIKELETSAIIHWHKAERDAALKALRPFKKSKKQLSEAGKKGKRLPDAERITKAQKILKEHPINITTLGKLLKLFKTHGLKCGKTWVAKHRKEILSAITPA